MAGSEIWTETRFYSRSRHFRIGQNRSDPAGTDCKWCFESDESLCPGRLSRCRLVDVGCKIGILREYYKPNAQIREYCQ